MSFGIKATNRFGLLLAASSLCACASHQWPGFASDPPAYRVSIGGETFLVRHITESTWVVGSVASLQMLDTSQASIMKLRQAVESASGCKVTNSDFSSQGRQFDAQVRCAGALVQ